MRNLDKLRVLHVLHHSVPYLDGYSIRSKSIVGFQRALGLLPTAVTSGHHEIEVGLSAGSVARTDTIDGIDYHRTPLPANRRTRWRLQTPLVRERSLVRMLEASIERLAATGAFDLIHAHSPILCGSPALRVARRHRIPFVYEVRAFWEDALLTSRQSPISRLKYVYSRGVETRLFRDARAVVAISRHMLEDIAARGIPRTSLFHVPNGVDTDQFVPLPRDQALAAQLGLGTPVIGFIGSFYRFEGLDTLVNAMPAILKRFPSARLVLVGTGEAAAEIKTLITSLGIDAAVLQLGRVPHEDILRYYSIMDVLVYPRHRDRTTELVTPLKPLEALALGKPVIGSDVGGITELLDDGRAGVLFRAGDATDLAARIIALFEDDTRRARLSAEGRAYAMDKRRWSIIASQYLEVYRHALR